MTDAKYIVENTLVPHTAFEKATSRLEQCYTFANGASEPICIAILGESRTGKSRVLEECYAKHPQVRNEDGLTVPILRVKVPSKPTVKSLAETMLYAMRDDKFDKGTESVKTNRLRLLMRNTGTKMVMLDEFQHFYDMGTRKIMHHVADWLKILVDDCRVALVVAGLENCSTVINQNEQLAGRFLSPIVMPRFKWENVEHRDEFIGILGAFQDSIGSTFDIPDFDSADMAFRFYCGTGGLVGYLSKFLRQVVWNAVENNKKCISIEDLALAHMESVWSKETLSDINSPFSRDFKPVPTIALLESIAKIGVPVLPVEKSRICKAKVISSSSRQILSAS